MNACPEWFSGFEPHAMQQLLDAGSAKGCRNQVQQTHRDSAGEQQQVGLQARLNGSVQFGR
jgi:hypothetical protein